MLLFPLNSMKSAECSADGKKVWKRKLPRNNRRRKYCVSRKHLIAGIPVVEIVDIAVPPVIVPVHVRNANHFRTIIHYYHCQSKPSKDCAVFYLRENHTPPDDSTNKISFLKNLIIHSIHQHTDGYSGMTRFEPLKENP